MKKLVVICLFMLLVFMGVTQNVDAFPYIEVTGTSNPWAGTITDNGTTTTFSQVDYFFDVTNDGGSGAEMNWLSLEFENDIFKSVGSISGLNPADWTPAWMSSGTSGYQIASAGTTVGVGDQLTFSILNVTLFNTALDKAFQGSAACTPPVPGAGCWDEGQIWAQSVSFKDDMGGADGTSTAPIPEPGTFMLLGTGLVGAVLYTRKKKCLISI